MNTTKSLLINDSFWRTTAEGDPALGQFDLKDLTAPANLH